jgi:hypothetical protein
MVIVSSTVENERQWDHLPELGPRYVLLQKQFFWHIWVKNVTTNYSSKKKKLDLILGTLHN